MKKRVKQRTTTSEFKAAMAQGFIAVANKMAAERVPVDTNLATQKDPLDPR